jgi:hypothetical protein
LFATGIAMTRCLGFTARGLQTAQVSLAKQVILDIAAAD